MAIPEEHKGRYIYHMTHLNNLESILQNGIFSTNIKKSKEITHQNIANQGIQKRRSKMDVICGPKGMVHDYVPFYFCSQVPMLLGLLNTKNVDQQFIVYLAINIDIIERDNVVFTSASANTAVLPNFYHSPEDLNNLRWDLIDSPRWGYKDEERHLKMAEVLVHKEVEPSDIDFIVVWNEKIKENVEKILKNTKLKTKIKFNGYKVQVNGSFVYRNHYFCKFFRKGEEQRSLITGPFLLRALYEDAVETIKKTRKDGVKSNSFKNLHDMTETLDKIFCCLPELKEIYKLETVNEQHFQNIGEHTKTVVKNLKSLLEFSKFTASQKEVLIVAAYLHDIGKGKSPRDKNGKQQTDSDHPALSAPMLERILSEEICEIKNIEIRQIVMLVLYHDLIGDVIGNGRDEKQIIELIENMDEFDMLASLSKADVKSLIESVATRWLENINDKLPGLRENVQRKFEKD